MRLEKDFELCKITGELRLTYRVTNLGCTPDMVVSALIGDGSYRMSAPAAIVVRDMQRQIERELGRLLFKQ